MSVTELKTAAFEGFEKERSALLAQPENLAFLMNLPGMGVDRVNKGRSPKRIIPDSATCS